MPETKRPSPMVETQGSALDGSLRFRAVCACGWATAPLLTAMQAHHAAEDHTCRKGSEVSDG